MPGVAMVPVDQDKPTRLMREQVRLWRQRQRWEYHWRRGQLDQAEIVMDRIKATFERIARLEEQARSGHQAR